MKYFKKFKIKLNNKRRWIILGLTSFFSILSIGLGSSLYIPENSKKSIEYGGGAEYLVKINTDKTSSKAKAIASQVSQEIYERIDALGISGAEVNPEISRDDVRVRIKYPGITTENQKKEIENLITNKARLTLTDVFGNPLFDENGYFRMPNPNKPYDWDKKTNSKVPISPGGAKAIQRNSKNEVAIQLTPNLAKQWEYATRYISSLKKGYQQIIAWLNINEFVKKIKNHPSIWKNSGKNPVIAAYVPFDKKETPNKNNFYDDIDKEKKKKASPTPVLWKHVIDAGKYLISRASVEKPLVGNTFVIEGNFNRTDAKLLSREINYGTANYSLKLEYSNFIKASYGGHAFHKALIAGIIVFIFIAIFLIINYGLLGALSTISIALYMFITLTMFTVMRGEYSPESIAALIIGVGMAVDANIITYERLKNEIYSGSTIQKSFKDANKKSLSTIFDANITTFIVAIVLFYFGTRNIIGLSVTLILSIMLTFVVMLGFTRFTSSILVNMGIFENKKYLLGLKPKIDLKIQRQIDKFDYINNAKWFTLGSGIIFAIGLITLFITAIIAKSFSGGFNLSQDFLGGTIIQVTPQDGEFNIANVTAIHEFLIHHGIDASSIQDIKSHGKTIEIKYSSTNIIKNMTNLKAKFIAQFGTDFKYLQSITTNDAANKILKNAVIAVGIAIVGIIIYTLFRFKWTYSIAAIIALMHDAIIVVSMFIIFRIQISPVFIAGLLAIIGYSINDTIVTFDRVRENMTNYKGNLNKESINKIANSAIKKTLKRSVLTSFTTIIAVVVLMSFGNATKMSFNLAMFIGLIAGTYSSIFIATYLWTKLELIRQKRILLRGKNNFWNTDEIEEQVFTGINDFKI